jgi:sarcosine oxidase subunit delta
MRIPCPLCGERALEEFAYLGDATVKRPAAEETDPKAWYDFVYLRDNPRGPHRELWHHLHGCRAWLEVERDTLTHEVFDSRLARERGTEAK